ncbi:MAG: UUP1 family membrane protein, partial [Planctomycetota bacterium]
MNDRHAVSIQLGLLSLILVVITVVVAGRKVAAGMPLLPDRHDVIWQIEAVVSFTADPDVATDSGEPRSGISASLTLPDVNGYGFRILDEHITSAGFGHDSQSRDDGRRVLWTKRTASGRVQLSYRCDIYDLDHRVLRFRQAAPPAPSPYQWPDNQRPAVEALIREARRRSASTTSFIRELVRLARDDSRSGDMTVLLGPTPSP